METYSVGVALFDFVPVLLSAIGLHLLARGISYRHHALRHVALVAATLIPLGGFCKATWKLLVALQGVHLDWLENLLFILLAPGFIVLALSLRQARIKWQRGIPADQAQRWNGGFIAGVIISLGGALLAALLAPDTRIWFFWLLAMTTLANMALLIQAALTSRWLELDATVIVALLINFVATLSLSGLSRMEAGEMSAWIQQSVNLLAQGALLFGLWRLSRAMRDIN